MAAMLSQQRTMTGLKATTRPVPVAPRLVKAAAVNPLRVRSQRGAEPRVSWWRE